MKGILPALGPKPDYTLTRVVMHLPTAPPACKSAFPVQGRPRQAMATFTTLEQVKDLETYKTA